MENKTDFMRRLRANEAQMRALGVERIGLFGSFLRDTATESSDVDVLVDFLPDQKNFDRFMALAFLLEEVLQRKVEVVTRESLSPYIGPHILDQVEYVEISS